MPTPCHLPSEDVLAGAGLALAREIAELQRADVTYLRPIVDELRQLRAREELLVVGTRVV